MKKVVWVLVIFALVFASVPSQAFAVNTATHGKISGRSVISGLVSLIIWPGIGQFINNNETKKNWTHAIIGLLPPFRLWSGWDGLIDRQGGRWDGKI
jgi:MFS-type transporter involved in bile tolerance (Atg22 family)